MNDNDARELLRNFSESWYRDVDYLPMDRVYQGKKSPPPHSTNAALIAGIEENIEQAKEARDGVRARYELAEREGLFDTDAIKTVSDKKLRAALVKAIETQAGDRARCVSELRHWREYLALALAGTLPRVFVSARELAESKALAMRETPEEIERREAAARARIAEKFAERVASREPGEDDGDES